MPNAEVRESSTAEFLIQRDFGTGATRIYWVRDIVRLKFRPYPTLYKYSEILSGGTGYVDGIDSSTPTALTKLIDPPGSPMSSIRTIVTQRELMRESPRLLHDMKKNPGGGGGGWGCFKGGGRGGAGGPFNVAFPGGAEGERAGLTGTAGITL